MSVALIQAIECLRSFLSVAAILREEGFRAQVWHEIAVRVTRGDQEQPRRAAYPSARAGRPQLKRELRTASSPGIIEAVPAWRARLRNPQAGAALTHDDGIV